MYPAQCLYCVPEAHFCFFGFLGPFHGKIRAILGTVVQAAINFGVL
jgi:hypothetical protein